MRLRLVMSKPCATRSARIPALSTSTCIMNWRVSAFFCLIDIANGVAEPAARARMVEIWNPLEDKATPPAWRAFLRSAAG
jgi:hypothetical protein